MLRLDSGLELPPEQRLVLAIDTNDIDRANELAQVAKASGALIVKIGIELLTSPDVTLRDCSEVAAGNDLKWLADPKLYGTSKTLPVGIQNYLRLTHPPVGITVGTWSGVESLRLAQEIADRKGIMIFGVGHLSTIDEEETQNYSRMSSLRVMLAEATKANDAGLRGMVTSGRELPLLKSYKHTKELFSLVVGTRSAGVVIKGDDQKRKTTLFEAARSGADLIEIGRQVTDKRTKNTAVKAMKAAADEVARGLVTQ